MSATATRITYTSTRTRAEAVEYVRGLAARLDEMRDHYAETPASPPTSTFLLAAIRLNDYADEMSGECATVYTDD